MLLDRLSRNCQWSFVTVVYNIQSPANGNTLANMRGLHHTISFPEHYLQCDYSILVAGSILVATIPIRGPSEIVGPLPTLLPV